MVRIFVCLVCPFLENKNTRRFLGPGEGCSSSLVAGELLLPHRDTRQEEGQGSRSLGRTKEEIWP